LVLNWTVSIQLVTESATEILVAVTGIKLDCK
jgi:hypothetical protein